MTLIESFVIKRGTVRVKCLAQEHDTMSPGKAGTWTTQSGNAHTNHLTTRPPQFLEIEGHYMDSIKWAQAHSSSCTPIPLYEL